MKINCVKLSNQIQKVDSVYVSTDGPHRGSFGPVFFFLKQPGNYKVSVNFDM